MKETLMSMFVQYALPPLITALGLGLAWLVTQGGRYIAAHVKNVQVQGILTRLFTHVETAVRDVEQTLRPMVREFAADGKIDAKEQAMLKKAAIDKVKDYLGLKGLKELPAILGFDAGMLDDFIGSHVEATVNRLKVEQTPAITATAEATTAVADPK